MFHMDPENRKKLFKRWGRDVQVESHPSVPPFDPCSGAVVPNFAVSNHYMDLEQLAARNKFCIEIAIPIERNSEKMTGNSFRRMC